MARGAAIIIEDEKVALIRRKREGHTYYLFPGGGVEAGETAEEAAIREAWEELGLRVRLDGLVLIVELSISAEQVTEQYYFLAHTTGGTFGTGDGAELSSRSDSTQGSYTPLWIPLVDLLTYDVRPKELAQALASQTIASMAASVPMRIKEKYLPPGHRERRDS